MTPLHWLLPIPVTDPDTRDPIMVYALRGRRLRLRRSFVRWLFISSLMLGGVWLGILASAAGWARITASNIHISFIFFASILVNLLLDLACITAGLSVVNREAQSIQHDLLRLTPRSAAAICRARHVVAQIQAWPLACFVVSMRLVTVLMALLTFLFIQDDGRGTPLSEYLATLDADPTTLVTMLVTLPVFALVYVLEPFWRLRAMTAVALGAARHQRAGAALLEGLGWIVGLAISQMLIMAIIFFLLVQMTALMFGPPLYSAQSAETLALLYQGLVAGACVLTGVLIHQYYALLTRFSLDNAAAQVEAG